ncbi:tRNA (N6-threonylcarbamoyladenosine(37)-N6)-methyltransferase TrmO [Vibrio sp. LaRot3]|uniref:tRNA (N6-threonylcarbamoyladenosine(37)-N6)-methyltransferase TrmO n=1 Tax=Vibrio sp. LaRot3 TaxID=2998829 RepID=UPI0022CE1CE6|nr:tRNA (N6-threonylcarbamoyladenosine(37)-N6)-methyltransferase TrmO [Vibrio sp. LaRot3]MDA0147903.1 tRNA (N6-threonylcarbamoyladenosine(37)-N6)-methyltransferase TrmO [Vibrio sp. LaRot3]
MRAEINYIGTIATPYTSLTQCPSNIDTDGPNCQIMLFDSYKSGLEGLKTGEEILILYWLEQAQRSQMVQEGKQGITKGTFALRSPHRPNPIGAAVLPIESINNGCITVKGLDCLDGTPVIDIKPAIKKELRD